MIISAGDAEADKSIFDKALESALPHLVPKIQNAVGGRHYVAAVGASCVARQNAIRPEIVGLGKSRVPSSPRRAVTTHIGAVRSKRERYEHLCPGQQEAEA